ncbi:MAG: 5'-deoxynucleotidase [Ruminococcus sp.]|nr:5'-deoxynucleotidase [Ruminococcus sp.]MBQ7133270.1 5'-deoxynucleotidase [Ruminococcus sp.]
MKSHFFALMSRMKYINRWGLMNNTKNENISEHSLMVAMLSHALVVISNKRFGTTLNPEHAAMLGIYHDASEIITGDMPTPIKYFNPKISDAYKQIERIAEEKLVSYLPEDLRDEFAPLLTISEDDKEYIPFVKAADKLSALIKCIEEEKIGNVEFSKAHTATEIALENMNLPYVDVFMDEFLPSFSLTLDEQD